MQTQTTPPPQDTEAALLVYIQILQGTINRMATNSLYCKIICVTLLAALGTISNLKGWGFLLSGLIPLFLCTYGDSMYLSLERTYIKKFSTVANRKNGNNDTEDQCSFELFDMNPGYEYKKPINVWKAFCSWSIWPIYLTLSAYLFALACAKA